LIYRSPQLLFSEVGAVALTRFCDKYFFAKFARGLPAAFLRKVRDDISASENPKEIKYHLIRAELHNTIEFELLRASGKSRHAACLAKMIQHVSEEPVIIHAATATP